MQNWHIVCYWMIVRRLQSENALLHINHFEESNSVKVKGGTWECESECMSSRISNVAKELGLNGLKGKCGVCSGSCTSQKWNKWVNWVHSSNLIGHFIFPKFYISNRSEDNLERDSSWAKTSGYHYSEWLRSNHPNIRVDLKWFFIGALD